MSVDAEEIFDSAFVPLIDDRAIVRLMDNEAVVWAPTHVAPRALDPLAALMLQLADGSVPVDDLVRDVQEVIGVPEALARTQIQGALGRLDEAGMLRRERATEPVDPYAPLDLFPAPPST
jgi:hypothetical protein